nr:hypothetical protein [Tanacetum cinerariifolium]
MLTLPEFAVLLGLYKEDELNHRNPHPYTHYPDTDSLCFGGNHYGAHGDGYHAGSIVLSSGYKIGGPSAGYHGEDFDPIVHSKDCVESDDDEMRD